MGTDISDGHQMAKHRLQYPLSIPYLRAISCRVTRFVSPYQRESWPTDIAGRVQRLPK